MIGLTLYNYDYDKLNLAAGLWQGAKVAIKFVVSDSLNSNSVTLRESLLGQLLSHPNVIQVSDVVLIGVKALERRAVLLLFLSTLSLRMEQMPAQVFTM